MTDTAAPDVSQGQYPHLYHSEDPFPFFEKLQAEQPVYEVPGRGEFLVTRWEDVHYVGSHPEIFSSSPPDVPWSPGWSETMIAQDPPEHTALRKILQRCFSPARIRGYEPDVQAIVDGLIDNFIDHGEVEFITAFANPLSLRVTCWLMGLPMEDGSWLERLVQPFEAQGIRYHDEARQKVQMDNGAALVEYLREKVTERVEKPGDDLISELITLHTEATGGEPNLEYLIVESNVLLAGGLQTTGHMVGSAMALLVQHPEVMERVRADHSLIPRMLDEVLRLESPAQWQPRYTTQDTELGGVKIPRGASVLMSYSAANRDASRFECPAHFDIDRTNLAKHMAFGVGPHFCIGAPLARLEGRLAFERLFTRLNDIRPADHLNHWEHYRSVFMRAPAQLQLWFERA